MSRDPSGSPRLATSPCRRGWWEMEFIASAHPLPEGEVSWLANSEGFFPGGGGELACQLGGVLPRRATYATRAGPEAEPTSAWPTPISSPAGTGPGTGDWPSNVSHTSPDPDSRTG